MEQVATGHRDRGDGVRSSGSPFCRRSRCSQDVHLPAEGMQVTGLHYFVATQFQAS